MLVIFHVFLFFFFFKQKTAYEMRISDWSSDVCSSDLLHADRRPDAAGVLAARHLHRVAGEQAGVEEGPEEGGEEHHLGGDEEDHPVAQAELDDLRSEEHTSELQSLMRRSYAVLCLKKNIQKTQNNNYNHPTTIKH